MTWRRLFFCDDVTTKLVVEMMLRPSRWAANADVLRAKGRMR